MPEDRETRELFIDHDGLLVDSPEYSSSITAVIQNVINWMLRPALGEPPLVVFRGKVATLMSASPDALGDRRGLVHLRSIPGNIGVIILPDQISVAEVQQASQPVRSLTGAKRQAGMEALDKTLASFLIKLSVQGKGCPSAFG